MSFLVEPQTNASILASILMQIDPAQHDAVVLMNRVLENQHANAKAVLGLQGFNLDSWRNDNALTTVVSQLAEKSISHKVSIEEITNTLIHLAELGLGNGLNSIQQQKLADNQINKEI